VQLLTGTMGAEIGPGALKSRFVAYPSFGGARSHVGLLTHILGHASWDRLIGNFMLILLVGPMLEERYGSGRLLAIVVVTGLANALLTNPVVFGASGVAFMMILLVVTVWRYAPPRLPDYEARASKKLRRALLISARCAAPDTTTSTIVSEVWVWPRAVTWRTGTPAAASAWA
jgi:hypothetical protein